MTAAVDLETHLATHALARIVEVHESIGSTNDRAKHLARLGAAHGVTVIARAQTQGRGQRGRIWESPPGGGLYVSFIVRSDVSLRLAQIFPLLAGLSVFEAIARVSEVPTMIKWPNDLLVRGGPHHGKKIAGILVEMVAETQKIAHAVIGIGINLHEGARSEALAAHASSLEQCGVPAPVRLEPLLAAIAHALEGRLVELAEAGAGGIVRRIIEELAGRGDQVEIDVDGARTSGTLDGIQEDGAVLIDGRAHYRGELRLQR